MPIVLNGTTGITTPTYNGSTTAEYLVPVTGFKNRLINGDMGIAQRGTITMYQKINNLIAGEESKYINRLFDNSLIPFDPSNTDYQAYLKWLEEGNTPLPADEVV